MNPVHYEDFIPYPLHTPEMDAPKSTVSHQVSQSLPPPGPGIAVSITASPNHPASSDHEFTTLVRLLSDFAHKRHLHHQPFVPRFDLEEHEHTYELYGDFPGVGKEDISVSVVDNARIEVRGVLRHRRSEEDDGRERADHTHDVLVGGVQNAAIHNVKVEDVAEPAPSGHATHQPDNHTGSHIADTNARPALTTTASNSAIPAGDQTHPAASKKIKEIIKERQEGEFHRIFHFAQPVILDNGVQARMENGVLHVTIPRGPAVGRREVDVGWLPYL